jgi:DNA-directed RNA polymerase subunit RPC12/RpoP
VAEVSSPALFCRECGTEIFRKKAAGSAPTLCMGCRKVVARRHCAAYRARYGRKPPTEYACVDCHERFRRISLKGRPPTRCPECNAEHRRTLHVGKPYRLRENRVRGKAARARSERFDTEGRWSSCNTCGASIPCRRFGPLLSLCDACVKEVRRKQARKFSIRADIGPATCIDCDAAVSRRGSGRPSRRCTPCRKLHRTNIDLAWVANNRERCRIARRRALKLRRARKKGAVCERFDSGEIFERDKWICGICKKQIDKKLRWPHMMSASIDHVVPLSEGGAHGRANCRASHWKCNSLRSNRGGGEQLALIG